MATKRAARCIFSRLICTKKADRVHDGLPRREQAGALDLAVDEPNGLKMHVDVLAVRSYSPSLPPEDTTTTGGSGSGGGATATGGGSTGWSGEVTGTPAATVPTRFHATKEVTLNRVVRDVGQIYEEVVSHFVLNAVPVRVTIDVESDQLEKLTEDQRTAIRENLKTLGFADDDWSMD